ncbi:MAG TPA: hypothetical protein PLV19_04455 [Nitrosomonas sp.]|nr:hypothetical protein [Nitrosomonas sp.]HQX13403.1 hypothetical protein [Nitrosomonas sp.]HRB20155.1 hypothetical protein [Nitrosomonas sp.]HRB31685.1 hypothetical protein [Nitrosomonas sp.]HRB44475.1 hypothetical protein [Nitrosomonas sp.]
MYCLVLGGRDDVASVMLDVDFVSFLQATAVNSQWIGFGMRRRISFDCSRFVLELLATICWS